jgi:hypothetical protein
MMNFPRFCGRMDRKPDRKQGLRASGGFHDIANCHRASVALDPIVTVLQRGPEAVN